MSRLVDIRIDAEGDEIVFRVTPGAKLRAWFGALLRGPQVEGPRIELREGATKRGGDRSRIPREKPPVEENSARARHLDWKRRYLDAADPQSTKQIGEADGVSSNAVKKALAALGVPIRSHREARLLVLAKQRKASPAEQALGRLEPSPPADRTARRKAADPRSTGAPPRKQTHEPPATPTKEDTTQRDAEIVRRYADELEGFTSLAAVFTGGDVGKLKAILKARGVALRTAGEQMRIAWGRREKARNADPLGPKPKPIAVPDDAPRREYVPPPPPPPGRRGDAYRKTLSRHFSKTPIGLSPEDQQKLVAEHFAKGGAVTRVPPAPADYALKFSSGVGAAGDGRKRR